MKTLLFCTEALPGHDITVVKTYPEAINAMLEGTYDRVVVGRKTQFGHFVLIAATEKGTSQTGVWDGEKIKYFRLSAEGLELLKFLSSQ